MTSAFCIRACQKLKCLIAILALGMVAAAHGEESWHLMIEPTFLKHEVAWPIPGSKLTVLVPARMVDGEPVPLKRADVVTLGVTRPRIEASASTAATHVLKELTPRFVRDEKNVIQYAVLESENPLTASAVLAPQFAETFEKTLGPDLLVVIPNRFRIYVFPKLSPVHKGFADIVASDYISSAYPVSREIFEWRNGTLTAIGSYR